MYSLSVNGEMSKSSTILFFYIYNIQNESVHYLQDCSIKISLPSSEQMLLDRRVCLRGLSQCTVHENEHKYHLCISSRSVKEKLQCSESVALWNVKVICKSCPSFMISQCYYYPGTSCNGGSDHVVLCNWVATRCNYVAEGPRLTTYYALTGLDVSEGYAGETNHIRSGGREYGQGKLNLDIAAFLLTKHSLDWNL